MSDEVSVDFKAMAFRALTEPPPSIDVARDALIELFVLANSHANYMATNGVSQTQSERLFAIAMRKLLDAGQPESA